MESTLDEHRAFADFATIYAGRAPGIYLFCDHLRRANAGRAPGERRAFACFATIYAGRAPGIYRFFIILRRARAGRALVQRRARARRSL